VVLPDPRGQPAGSTINWTNGFLPARHQGVAFRTKGQPIEDLFPATGFDADVERDTRAFVNVLNQRHRDTRPESELEARLRSYELAARMQLSVPDVTDLSSETAATQEAYGLQRTETAEFGRSCLLARRLLERGVRFVQLFSGGSFGSPRINWDGHENVKENHTQEALRVDQPTAALLKDLRQRGLLDDTLVLFTTEFGRTPVAQSEANTVGAGRDHNMYGFSVWMAGGGLKHGHAHGSTDDVGWKSVDQIVTWPDFHATVLHLLGIDHTRLTYYHNGIQRRLTNVHGHIVQDVLA
jgi:membrane-anchored protein YejM (alkaline phosphatase superfamily)